MLSQPVLIYDGNCAFCRHWVDRLHRADRYGRIVTIPADQRGNLDLPPLSDEELSRAMYLVLPDRTIRRGARALPELLRRLPGWRLLAPLFRIPGVLWVADRVYQWIARRRHRLGCKNGACGIS